MKQTGLLQTVYNSVTEWFAGNDSRENVKVYLEANGGTVDVNYITVTYNDTYGTLPTPIKEGYAFVGWYYNGTKIEKDTKVNLTEEDHTVIAEWERLQYKVVYHANGGAFTDGTDTYETMQYFDYNIDLSVRTIKSPYVFVGWALSENGEACLMNKPMPAEEVHLYAVYSMCVSDIKEAVLLSWNKSDTSIYKEHSMELSYKEGYGYYYEIEDANIKDGLNVNNKEEIGVSIVLYDHAGNRAVIPVLLDGNSEPEEEVPELPSMYLQTTMHYTWNMITESWVYVASTGRQVYEGEIYTPEYLKKTDEKYPIGYEPHSIDAAYTVTNYQTTKAYYMPIGYKLYFDANGGSCDTEYKTVYKDNYIGTLPSATKKGHEFLGWYTKKDAGLQIFESDIYTAAEDTTVYAKWKARTYNVTYDYATNGGNKADINSTTAAYGDAVDLSVKANKEGWEFIGWNTDKNATAALDELTMSDSDVILFAIYKKDLTVTLIDKKDSGIVTRKETASIYNTSESATFKIPKQNEMTGWECLGWSTSTAGNAVIEYASHSSITITENVTLYGCYEKDVVISFDTNGSLDEVKDITDTVYYNAADEYVYPTVIVPAGPTLRDHSFVIWEDKDNTEYNPGDSIVVKEDMVLIAQWDKVPEIEAYDRYFSLSTAQRGDITQTVLFQKVTATDLEDGLLQNGRDVTILGYQASDFTSFTDDGSITVTYVAEDSFGNITKKTVTVYIVNTGSIEPLSHEYIRFIDLEYYIDNAGNYVSPEDGGLENQSKWITDTAYAQTLLNVLSYKKENIETNIFDFYGKEIEVPDISSGEWPYVKSTWTLSKSKIDEVKEFVKTNGYGKFKNKNAIVEFYNKFSGYQN